jgi:hypothetical protein
MQMAMGGVAVLSLIWKRSREHPHRPWKIWCYDVSKQVIGAGGMHCLNVLASILFSNTDEPDLDKNPCNWYFINVLLDTTVGVPILWGCLTVVHRVAHRAGVKDTISGRYGNPPRFSAFAKQASLYMLAMFFCKILLYLVEWWVPFLDDMGEWLIGWTNYDSRVQVAFVMMVFPLW